MPSLLTAAQISGAEALRDAAFDTWARAFVIYKTPQITIIDSNTNYNYTYGTQPEGQGTTDYVNYTIQSGMFSGCIQYSDTLEKIFSNPQGAQSENLRIVMDKGLVRLKVKKADFDNYIKDSQSFLLDGKTFTLFRTERPHGLFQPRYYTLYLQYQN
jgi:hypothetical protein